MQLSHDLNRRTALLTLALVIAAIQFVRSNFGTLSVVEGSSMYPTFKPSDVVQAKNISAESQRGDVVIITDNRGERVIKRILGLPGETVSIFRGYVYVERTRLREPYLASHTYTFNSNPDDERACVWHLGAGEFFMLGDNRLESCDSRHYGPVKRGQINKIVELPENAEPPSFCELQLSENGKVTPVKNCHPNPGRSRQRNPGMDVSAKS